MDLPSTLNVANLLMVCSARAVELFGYRLHTGDGQWFEYVFESLRLTSRVDRAGSLTSPDQVLLRGVEKSD